MSAGRTIRVLFAVAPLVCLHTAASHADQACFSDNIRTVTPTGNPGFAFLVQTSQGDRVFLSREGGRFREAGWQVGDAIKFCLLSRSWDSYQATNLRNGTVLDLTMGKDTSHP